MRSTDWRSHQALLVALACLLAGPALATIRYLSQDGSDSGNALTEATSWDTPAYALGASSSLAPGDTLMVLVDRNGAPGAVTWSTASQWFRVFVNVAKCGISDAARTWVLPDTGAVITIDLNGQSNNDAFCLGFGNGSNAVFSNWGIGWSLGTLRFRNLAEVDGDRTDGDNDAFIRFHLSTGAQDTTRNITLENLEFDSASIDTSVCLASFTANSSTTDWMRNVKVSNCRGYSKHGRSAITIQQGLYCLVENNFFHRDTTFVSGTESEPKEGINGINLQKTGTHCTVRGNEILGFDHGMEINGTHHLIEGNRIHTINDDFLFINGFEVNLCESCVLRYNVCWDGGDNAIDVRGIEHEIYDNTFYSCTDNMINFGTNYQATRCRIYNNLFFNTASTDYFLASNPHNGLASCFFDGNWYYDNAGTEPDWVYSGTGHTFSVWQAAGRDVHGYWNVDPKLYSNSIAASTNLRPVSGSGMLHTGLYGRTIGGLACADCFWPQLTVTGDVDSVHYALFSRLRVPVIRFQNAALWSDGNVRFADVDLDSTATGRGQQIGRWVVYEGGDSTIVADDVILEHVQRRPYR